MEDLVTRGDRLWSRVLELELEVDRLRLENARLKYRLGEGEEP